MQTASIAHSSQLAFARGGALRRPADTTRAAHRVSPRAPSRTQTVIRAVGTKATPVYMSRDSQRHEKLTMLLDAELDSDAGLARQTQINLAKDLILRGCGVDDPSMLADDFQYCTPYADPLSKEDYLAAMRAIDLKTAFPGGFLNARHFRVQWDSKVRNQDYKVWCRTQFKGMHRGTLNFGRAIAATGKTVVGAPEIMSLTFNTRGKCKRITAEYVVDATEGNTGGWGGIRGIMHAIGKPVPAPWTLQGKLCKSFPALMAWTDTTTLWAINAAMFASITTGFGRPAVAAPDVSAAAPKTSRTTKKANKIAKIASLPAELMPR